MNPASAACARGHESESYIHARRDFTFTCRAFRAGVYEARGRARARICVYGFNWVFYVYGRRECGSLGCWVSRYELSEDLIKSFSTVERKRDDVFVG